MPLNRRRIVHITGSEDPALIERQLEEGADGWLVGFLTAFIERELSPTEAGRPVAQR